MQSAYLRTTEINNPGAWDTRSLRSELAHFFLLRDHIHPTSGLTFLSSKTYVVNDLEISNVIGLGNLHKYCRIICFFFLTPSFYSSTQSVHFVIVVANTAAKRLRFKALYFPLCKTSISFLIYFEENEHISSEEEV